MKKNQNEVRQMALDGTEDGEILARLSERVEKAVALIQELRRERDDLRKRLTSVEERLRDQDQQIEGASGVQGEYERFRAERGEIRSRIERILGSLESLEGEG